MKRPVRGDNRLLLASQKAFIFRHYCNSLTRELAPKCMNESGTCANRGTKLTQLHSPFVLPSHGEAA